MTSKKQRIRRAVQAIQDRGEYPSANRINKEMGRSITSGLNGRECEFRREIFDELGITIAHRGSDPAEVLDSLADEIEIEIEDCPA